MSYSLLLDQTMHGVVGLPFAIYVLYKSRSWGQFLIVMAIVIFIDIDHWIDYWLYFGWKFNITEFLGLEYYAMKGTAVVPFHAWEWSVILYYIAKLTKNPWKSVYMAMAVGVFAHLVWDIHNFWSFEFYSIMWRSMNGFKP